MTGLARLLILVGALLVLVGLVLLVGSRWFKFGQLPGDLRIERENYVVHIPLGTMLLVSLLLTLVLNVAIRLLRR